MVHLAHRYSRPLGMGFCFGFLPQKKRPFVHFPWSFHFSCQCGLFLKLEGASGGTPGEEGWQRRTPSSSSRDSPLFLSSSALPPLSPEFRTMGYEVDQSSVSPVLCSFVDSLAFSPIKIPSIPYSLIYLHPVLSYTGVRWRHQYILGLPKNPQPFIGIKN